VPAYQMEAPRDLSDALERLAQPGVWKPFAGGTDLMVLLEAGKLPHRRFLSIWKFPELRGIEVTPQYVILGSLTTYTSIRRNEALAREFPLLGRAAAETGSIATQNRGTLGGNIANASPAADSPPALLVYDAELELVSASGSRWVPYHGFWTGYKKTGLRADELIRRIRLPRAAQEWQHYYRKVGIRRAQAISKICFAAAARMDSGRIADLRIALGSVAPTVLRAVETEGLFRGEHFTPAILNEAQSVLAREIVPIDDMRSTALYRRRIAQNLLAEFCETLSA
jgi:CO/xanthine dehydrogenase FAD-binding subunit